MTTKSINKLKKLLTIHKPGTVSLASWLLAQGISRDLQQYYCKSGWLEPIGHGAYKRPDDVIDYHGGLYALQEQANLDVHIGGITALTIQGAAHNIRFGGGRVYLFSPPGTVLPSWFNKHDWGVEIVHVRTNFLPIKIKPEGVNKIETTSGARVISNQYSCSERAILECLYLTPDKQDLVESFQVMDGLVNLRPKVVQLLLEQCTSVKVNRLFLYMAEKSKHQWLQYVEKSLIKLGKGDRSIVKNGTFIAKYHISVPEELALL